MTVVLGAVALATPAFGQNAPITITGFTQDVIAESNPPSASTTAAFDSNNNYAFASSSIGGGLPSSGSFISAANTTTSFQLGNYAANNALLFNTNANVANAPAANSGSIAISAPNSFTTLALLSSAANNNTTDVINYTLNFSDNTSTGGTFNGSDWFNGTPYAIASLNRVARGTGVVENNGTNPRMYETDITVPSGFTNKLLTGITFSTAGTGFQWALFAVSGLANGTGVATLTWNGDKSANWDTTTANWQGNQVFSNLSSAIFNDSASGTTAITVQAGGVAPSQVTFANTSKNYSFTGGPILSSGAATFTGGGTVTFNDALTFPGGINVSSGTVVVGAIGSINSPSLAVNSGATLSLANGSSTSATNGSATVLTGSGALNIASGILLVGGGTGYSGTLAGAGGINISAGTVTVNSATALSLTGGVFVGSTNASTAQLIINDGSGSAGLVGGLPITVTVAGTGPAGLSPGTTSTAGSIAGALRGADGVNAVFSGNVVIAPVGAYVGGGSGGTLTLNGIVSGSGPVTYSSDGGSTTILNGANVNTGEVRFGGDSSSFDAALLQLGNNNALGSGGIAVKPGAGPSSIDLHGFNQSSAYLSGGGPTVTITNGGSTPSILTINGPSGASGILGSPINDGNSTISVVKTGASNQSFTAVNSYSGGTNVAAGTLTVQNSGSLGSGPVLLSGGTLRLSVGAGNLTNFGKFQVNGGASVTNNVLQLTDNVGGQARSAFTAIPVLFTPTVGFTATFNYNAPNATNIYGVADGVTFTIQNDSRGAGAIGGPGGGLAYGAGDGGTPINNSVSLQYNLYQSTIGFGTNGTVNDTMGLGPYPGYNQSTTVTYDPVAKSITQTLVDGFGNTDTRSFAVDLLAVLGGNSGYVGFTGATGGVSDQQYISNFTFTSGVGITSPVNLSNPITTAPNTSSNLSASVTTGFNATTLGSLNLTAGSTVKLISEPNTAGTRLVVSTPVLVIAPTATLDVTNNDVVVQNGDIAALSALARTGQANGFTGTGITSSTAAADSRHSMAVAVVLNTFNGTQLFGNGTTFDGVNPGANDVLIKYTYFGDANLDGKVDGSDYSRIDAGYLTAGSTGWANGDFNYDGKVDGSDYTLIDNAFNRQGVALNSAALVASPTALVAGSPTSAVPEPASLGVIVIAAVLGRRRR